MKESEAIKHLIAKAEGIGTQGRTSTKEMTDDQQALAIAMNLYERLVMEEIEAEFNNVRVQRSGACGMVW